MKFGIFIFYPLLFSLLFQTTTAFGKLQTITQNHINTFCNTAYFVINWQIQHFQIISKLSADEAGSILCMLFEEITMIPYNDYNNTVHIHTNMLKQLLINIFHVNRPTIPVTNSITT